jgi:RNA polymerase sigma-70 factor (ECF subfamily)
MVFASLAVQLLAIPVAQPTAPATADAALVSQAIAGDSRAFRSIFERHAPAVRRYLRDLLRDAPAADEATQETFVRAHARLDAIRDADRLGPWLFGIARNVHLEYRRKLKRARPSGAVGDDALPEPVDAAPSPEEVMLGREADVVLAEALAAVSEERRAALVLRIDHELGYDEIAAHMHWSVQKVKNEIHRGRLQLRAPLAKYIGGSR